MAATRSTSRGWVQEVAGITRALGTAGWIVPTYVGVPVTSALSGSSSTSATGTVAPGTTKRIVS